jgi:hypothetical protein
VENSFKNRSILGDLEFLNSTKDKVTTNTTNFLPING